MNADIIKAFAGGIRGSLFGRKIREKVIIIESDDWGAIRTPSKEAVVAFEKEGFDILKGVYYRDALASEDDLNCLFEVLLKYRGADGKPAKITANSIMANPDFLKIKESGFADYYYERFSETFKSYPRHANNLSVWKQGLTTGIFQPQFHGREHLNVKRWLKALQKGEKGVRFCFDWKTTYSGQNDYSYMEAFDWDTPEDVLEHSKIIEDGLNIFEETFGFRSESFIAPCYNWDSNLESLLAGYDVRWLQGVRNQYSPTGVFGRYQKIKHTFGEKSKTDVRYNIRNCVFEPAMNPGRDWVNTCLAQISAAFLMGKPAVISSHRINYVGFIDEENRKNGLDKLSRLLNEINKRWPDAFFISTDQLNQYLND